MKHHDPGKFSSVVVVGGVNVDIGGHAYGQLVSADSNPGRVTVSLGGVGRNIAHNLRLLDVSVSMLAAIGGDSNGRQVLESCEALGIDLSHVRIVPDGTTSTYLYLTDPSGEMALAVSDMRICDTVTAAYLQENAAVLEQAQIVVADTNIPAESLRYLADHYGDKLFVDPVSTTKAEKLLPILSHIHTLKPNRLEAELLSGIVLSSPADAEHAARKLLAMGVKRVFISMGSSGVCAAGEDEVLWQDAVPGDPVNTTGCGDAFMAALVWASLKDCSLGDTARAGLAAGSIAMETVQTIAPHMSAAEVAARMGK